MSDEHRTKVFMLDDEKFLLEIYKIKFEQSGYEVSTYYDVDDALRVLRGGYDPEVILFDITMPGSRSGYEFIETLQKEGLGKHSIKVALTNEGQDGEKARLVELGVDAHLLKANFLPAQLVATVAKMLDTKKG